MRNEQVSEWSKGVLNLYVRNLLSAEAIEMYPVLYWVLARDQFEARGQCRGVMGRSGGWQNHEEAGSIMSSAPEQTQEG